MNSVLRVVVPAAQFAEPSVQGSFQDGAYVDYITPNLTPPAGAIYVARLDDETVTVISSNLGAFTSAHTFAGWPMAV